MTSRWIALCVFVMMVTLTVQQDPIVENMFDCNRNGISCMNDAPCDPDTGVCGCTEDFTGLGCEYNITFVSEMCDECGGAPCYLEDEAADSTCICPEDKYGPACEYKRVSLTCNPDSMDVKVAPLSNSELGFPGKIYVRDQATDNACYLVADPDMAGGYMANLGLTSCGKATVTTDADGNEEVSFSVIVQYDPTVSTDKDQIFTFTCGVLQSGGDQNLAMSMLESDNENSPLDEQTVKENLKPVTIAVLNDKGNPIDAPVTIGDLVSLVFTLEGGDVYNKFKVMDLKATNGLEEDDEESLQFIRDGCVAEEAGPRGSNVIQQFSGDPKTSISVLFEVFKFLFSYTVSFQSSVKLCKDDNTTACDMEMCDEFSGVGRRRRSLVTFEEEEGEFKQYNTTLFIHHPIRPRIFETNYRDEAAKEATMWSCINQPGFLAIIIALVILVLISLALVALYCVRAAHSKGKHEDQGYANKAFH